jgi:chromosome partitioning protein
VRTIAIINQKGGCGKTTTAINLAGVLAAAEQRVLLVDLDPQSHCAAGLAIPEQRIEVQIGDALISSDGAIDWTRLLWRVSRNLDLAPSTVRLAGVESARGGLAGMDGAEQRLKAVLTKVADQYDVCLLDCPPTIGLLTYSALVAAGEILIPVETGFFALQGATKQIQTIQALNKKFNVSTPFKVLPTIHDESSPMARDVLEELKRRTAGKVAPVVIRLDPKLREAVTFGQPIIEYAPDSIGAADYRALGRWVLGQPSTSISKVGAPAVTVRPTATDAVLSQPAPAPTLPPSPARTPSASGAAAGPARLSAGTLHLVTEPSTRAADMVARLTRSSVESRKREAEAAAAGLLGARSTAQGVLFVQPASVGQTVSVAGEFNGWSPTANPLKLNPDLEVLEAVVPLPPGRYSYRLIVDGRWMTDPFNPLIESNPFGEHNSVVTVHADTPAMATTEAHA